ncbi:transcription antitermination factor NusB [Candidatus Poriferisocius sp.]|uniref:transcription antitermination factor NusB n=1 Tax=Candidatus Poriferisocius sp. TaxID=3101276 RepID=UPI003B026EAE
MSRSQSGSASKNARAVAAHLLDRIERDSAYANLVLASADLPDRDAGLITELVYGVTRMRRALDHLVDGFVSDPPDLATRNLLRIGAYQLHMMDTPAYAAVSETVEAASRRQRGFVNAVLRRVADVEPSWPTDAVRLSYPDWMVERLEADLGGSEAHAALERMNQPAPVTARADGYVQDLASQWVAELVDPQPGERVLDMCAGPGGKATALAGRSAAVVAADHRLHRASLVVANAAKTGAFLAGVVAADGCHPPFRPHSFDRVLVDAPCSGLGVLGRRADARWRVGPDDVEELARLQAELVRSAFDLARPGGVVVYSVCTMTEAETAGIDHLVSQEHPDAVAAPISDRDPRWRSHSRGGLILPQDHNTDGMFAVKYQTPDR